MKTSAMWKKLLAEWRDKPQNEREYWQDMYLIKDLYPQYTKSSQNSTIRKQTTQLKTGPKTWTKTSPKKVYSWQIHMWKDSYHNTSLRNHANLCIVPILVYVLSKSAQSLLVFYKSERTNLKALPPYFRSVFSNICYYLKLSFYVF